MCLQLRKDFEEDKQRAVSRAVANAQSDVDSARRQTEERCKNEFAEEMKKVVQKHKTETSATKKKQWVGAVATVIVSAIVQIFYHHCQISEIFPSVL